MKLTLQYFALLRDQRGLDEETIESHCQTASALYSELAAQHGFTLPTSVLKVAINDDFSTWSSELKDGDRIVFIPPVAGG